MGGESYYGDDFQDGWNYDFDQGDPGNFEYSTVPAESFHNVQNFEGHQKQKCFIRKNLLVISGKFFTCGDWQNEPQPATATCVLRYKASGGWTSTSINLTLNSTPGPLFNVWSGQWDSSACVGFMDPSCPDDGKVTWTVYSAGGVVAATQGCFFVRANKSNVI